MDKKTRLIYMCPPRHPPQIERYIWTQSKEIEKDISCKEKGKKATVILLMSNKIDFRTKTILRYKNGHYIMIKGTIQQELPINLVNIYALKTGTPK